MKSNVLPFKVLSDENGDGCTIYLYGIIGQRDWWDGEQDITDTAFLKAMKDFEKGGKKRCDIRINSYGGSMFHMDAIIAQIQSSSMEVHTWVDGLAASAAADIWLSAPKERRHIAKNGKLMVHAPSTYAYGTAKALRDAADMLDVFEAGAIAQMASDTGMSEEDVKSKYFDGSDHWFSAKQCVETGFCAAIEDYEAQKMPENPEKMSAQDLINFYQPTKETEEPGWVQKIISALVPVKVATPKTVSPTKEEEMNLENLKASVGKEIAEDDVVKLIQDLGYDVTKKASAEAAPAVDVQKIVDDATAPLKAQIEAMQKQLDTTPGAGYTPAKAAGDPPSEEGDATDVMKQQADAHAQAAEKWDNPFLRG